MLRGKYRPKKLMPDFNPDTVDIRIVGNIIDGAGTGISLQGVRSALLQDNVIKRCKYPIETAGSQNIILRGNRIVR